MDESMSVAHIVYCKSRMLLDKGRYESWRDVQDTYPDYVASLGPWNKSEILEFLCDDFGSDDEKWPFCQRLINDYFDSKAQLLIHEEPVSIDPKE